MTSRMRSRHGAVLAALAAALPFVFAHFALSDSISGYDRGAHWLLDVAFVAGFLVWFEVRDLRRHFRGHDRGEGAI